MILRKPYAILIKNFKLLHAVIFAAMIFLMYKTYGILNFFSEYVGSEQIMIGENLVEKIYNVYMFIFPVVIILISLILVGIMILKKKPYVLYLINIFVYIYVFVMFNISQTTLSSLEVTLLDIRGVKMVRDLTTLAAILQIYPIIKNLVRATGFDIKKFDFGRDLQDLKIEEEDREEFEVNVNVDGNKIKRGLNSFIRNYKYLYLEHRLFFDTLTVVLIVSITGLFVISNLKTNNRYSMNNAFYSNGFTIKVTDSYSTRTNNKLKVITSNEKTSLIVVKVNIKSTEKNGKLLLPANVDLRIDDHIFRHKVAYRDSLVDMGKVYQDTFITTAPEDILLVFEIPTSYLNRSINIRFLDSISKNGTPKFNYIPLDVKDLDSNIETKVINAQEELSLDNTILQDTKITINNVSFSKKMKVDYTYCVTETECINSYEYLRAPLTTNSDRGILKLEAQIKYSENLISTNFSKMYDLIKYFGWIEYEVNDKTYNVSTGLNSVDPVYGRNNNILYLTVPGDIESASKIKLVFKIRNKIFEYQVK